VCGLHETSFSLQKKEKKEEKKERIVSFYPFESKSSPPPLPAFFLEKE